MVSRTQSLGWGAPPGLGTCGGAQGGAWRGRATPGAQALWRLNGESPNGSSFPCQLLALGPCPRWGERILT